MDFLEQFKKLLNHKTKDILPGESDGVWTKKVKETLIDLAEEKYKVCAGGMADKAEHEWLYDVVWYIEVSEADSLRLVDVPMVCESEWSGHWRDIKYDFEKLLLAKSRIKLMVCQDSKMTSKSIIDNLTKSVSAFSSGQIDENYYVAIFNNSKFAFEYYELVKSA